MTVRPGKALWKRFRVRVEEGNINVTQLAAELEISTQLLRLYIVFGKGCPKLRAAEIKRITGWDEFPRISQPTKKKRASILH